MDFTKGVVMIAASYLLGSIPFAYLAGRWLKGVDLRELGDGNLGAANVYHQVNRWAGAAVGVLDISKGAALVALSKLWGFPEMIVAFCALAAVIGHNWPIFLGFSGGQGVATSMGALSVLLPREAAISLAVALFFYLITRRLSLSGWFAKPQNFGGFAGYIAFVFLTFWIWEPWPPRIALIMVSLALLVRQIEKLKKGGAYLADLIQQVLKRGGE